MIKFILLLAAVAVVGILAYAATLPDVSTISRSIVVQAAPENVYPLINDMPKFNTWNPFNKKDPNIKGTYSGPSTGPGAKYAFEGNNDVGSGDIAIVESSSPSKVVMQLNMIKPMKATNKVTFTTQPEAGASNLTRVTWTMEGESPFFSKVMCIFINMDKMVGGEFEKGLASLKSLAESPAPKLAG
jgi:hypothetical protein